MNALDEQSTYEPPGYWFFPPMFTLQTNPITQEKQLQLWKHLILAYHSKRNLHHFVPDNFELFENSHIKRRLGTDGRAAIISYLLQHGHAEWDDEIQTRMRVILKKPETIAGEIYSWSQSQGIAGTIYTIYELSSGDEHQNTTFYGTELSSFKTALEILQEQGKCALLDANTVQEIGVKFL